MPKRKLVIGIIFTTLILSIIVGGILVFWFLMDGSDTNEGDGWKIKSFFYDKNGDQIKKTQSIIGGQEFSHISFKLYLSNAGDVELTNIRFDSSGINDLDIALQDEVPYPEAQELNVIETNILAWDTANDCPLGTECASNEECLGSPPKCLVNIESNLGEYSYEAIVLADYQDAIGQTKSYQANISISIIFEEPVLIDCYQETASESTACGGLDTGVYFAKYTNCWLPESFDGDWDTAGWGVYLCGISYTNVNYTKPLGATSNSFWEVKTGEFGRKNYTLPQSCWDLDSSILQLRTGSVAYTSAASIVQCKGDVDWVNLDYAYEPLINSDIYEEGMWWNT